MLNYETILSSYDDKMTLMQWLKKVEEALKDASATAFDVTRLDNERVKFSLTFANGEKLETSVLIAIKGEKGDTGTSVVRFYISNNHLYVELDNGVTQDLGLLFSGDINVSGTITASSVNVVDVLATGEIDGHSVTGDEIIEKMSGYSKKNVNAIVNDLVYTSICKNGNKLTIVFFATITPLAQTNYNLIQYEIPSNIGAKLYPFTSGSVTNLLDVKYASLFVDSTDITQAIMRVRKESNTTLTLELRAQPLTPNTQYYCRFEVTFLLGASL